MKEDDTMSTGEAAKLLKCSVSTVRNYWKAGHIEGEVKPVGLLGQTRLVLSRASVEALAKGSPSRS
jgi:excisionase family DNA binding protein